jgi:hypothetical protein
MYQQKKCLVHDLKSCLDFPLACIIAQLRCLLRYTHGVSSTKLNRNGHWRNDDVVAEWWAGKMLNTFHRALYGAYFEL